MTTRAILMMNKYKYKVGDNYGNGIIMFVGNYFFTVRKTVYLKETVYYSELV